VLYYEDRPLQVGYLIRLAVQRSNVLFAPKRRLRPVRALGRELIARVEADGAMRRRYLALEHGVQGGWSRRLEYIHPQGLVSPT